MNDDSDNHDDRTPEAPDWKAIAQDAWESESWQEAGADSRNRSGPTGAKQEPPPELTDSVVINLARMSPLQYAQQLGREAKKYKVPARLLEKAVDATRVEIEVEKLLEPHWEVNPAENPVDAARMFAEIEARILHHIAMPAHLAFVCALWVGYSWIHEHATYSPILFVTSPERESGKTTLMGVISFLVRRSLISVGISAPALYRSIEKWHPTFVIDEADEAFVDNPDLRQVVNSGWTRGQGVVRCEPDTHEPRKYTTFCPKAIAMKGKRAPDTLRSRVIDIDMVRRTEAEPVVDFAHIDDDGFRRLRSRLARWAADSGVTLGLASPAMPAGFMNRLAANWKLIFAIADSLGDEAGQRARVAAGTIHGITDLTSAGVLILEDIKLHFGRSTLEYVTSKNLIEAITADPERPWAEWSRGKPITEKGVADLLREFQIHSRTVGPKGQQAKGYRKSQFTDAWQRWLNPKKEEGQKEEANSDSPTLTSSRQPDCNHKGNGKNFAVNHVPGRQQKIDDLSLEINEVDGTTVSTPSPEPASFSLSATPSDDGLDIPESLVRTGHRCDHCGSQFGAMNRYDWSGRPDGIHLHRRCEGPWFDSARNDAVLQ
jgi:Protein of unknown function (DUF3631)